MCPCSGTTCLPITDDEDHSCHLPPLAFHYYHLSYHSHVFPWLSHYPVPTKSFKSLITIRRYCDEVFVLVFPHLPGEIHGRFLFAQYQHNLLGHNTGSRSPSCSCYQKNLALLNLSLIGFHSRSDFSTPLLRISTTPYWFKVSFRPKPKLLYRSESCEPNPVYLHSLMPRT